MLLIQFCSCNQWADTSLCTSTKIFYPDVWWTSGSWIRKCSLQLPQYFRWQSNNFKNFFLYKNGQKRRKFLKRNGSDRKITQNRKRLQWNDWKCRKYMGCMMMGNGGLRQWMLVYLLRWMARKQSEKSWSEEGHKEPRSEVQNRVER